MAKLIFNSSNEIEVPELVLGTRNYSRLGSITGITDLSYEYYLMQPNTINFQVHKTDSCPLWDDIRDGRFVWLKDYNEWYQITVKVDETDETVKTVTGTSLCECELGQVTLVDTEINTEEDIGRDNYSPTVFYNPDNESASLLHRLLKKAPHYQIGHVDQTLRGLQRTFSISDVPLYDELMGEIAEEFGCLFLFESGTRTIHAYDLLSSCPQCGHRGEYTGSCPHCGSTDISEGYGTDTSILVDTENLSESISLEGRMDEVKNYFRVCGGDEIIDSYVAAYSPSGTNYIYALSNFDREDMSAELSAKLEAYQKETAAAEGEYRDLVRELYNNIAEQLNLKSAMMPSSEELGYDPNAPAGAENELKKLLENNSNSSSSAENSKFAQGFVAVADETILEHLTAATAGSAVLGMAKCLVNSKLYRVTITAERLENRSDGKYWVGKFKLVNQSDSADCAESKNDVECKITADYQQYMEDKIQKAIDRSDVYLVDIFNKDLSLDEFTTALTSYCLERLLSFENAYQSALDVLTENGMADESHESYETLYKNYHNKLKLIEAAIMERQRAVYAKEEEYSLLEESKNRTNQKFNLRSYLGEELYKEFCSYRREDVYRNDNYISDGLTDTEIFKKAKELLETAEKEAQTASVLHYTLTSNLYNLLAMKEFQPLTDEFEGGNWIRIRVDNRLFKLRLIHYAVNYNNIQNLSVEFSDVTETPSGLSDVNSLMNQVQSMSTNFSYIARQSSQGEKAEQKINRILEDGLNASLSRIKNSDKQEIVIDSHGILGRRYDDITDTYFDEQLKLINNTLAFTRDNWKTVSTALGKITYTEPTSGEQKNQYGLIAQAVISGKVISNDIIGGNIYSENYQPVNTEHTFEKGSHINLNDGTFSFGDGSLRCEKIEDNYKLSFRGAVDITNTEDFKSTIGVSSLESGVVELQSQIEHTAKGILQKVSESRIVWNTKNRKIDLYGWGSPKTTYPAEDYTNYHYLDQSSGNLYYSSRGGWDVIEHLEKITDDFSSSITQLSDEICLKVNSGNLSSEISMEKDEIRIGSNRLTIESENFNLSNGVVESKKDDRKTVISNGDIDFYHDSTQSGKIRSGYEKGDDGRKGAGISMAVSESGEGVFIGVLEDNGSIRNYYIMNNGANPLNSPERHFFDEDIYNRGHILTNGLKLAPDYSNKEDDPNESNVTFRVKKNKTENSETTYTLLINGTHDTKISGNLYIDGELIIGKEKAKTVNTENYGTIKMNASETVDAYFSDIGSGKIQGDTCTIQLDPIFSETIETDCPYQVFLTNTSSAKTDYVEKHPGYFIIHGEDGASFDWMITAKQKGC